MTRRTLDGLTFGAAWTRAVGPNTSASRTAGEPDGEVALGGGDLPVSDDSGLTVERESLRDVLPFILLSSLVIGAIAFGLIYAFIWSTT